MDRPQQALTYLKGEMNETERAAFEEELTRSPELREELERSREMLELLAAASEETVVKRVNGFIGQAIDAGASHLHLRGGQAVAGFINSPDEDAGKAELCIVELRVEGTLREIARLDGDLHQPLVDRLKGMADCDPAERGKPQSGRIAVRYHHKPYDLRVTFLPAVQGESVTLQIVPRLVPPLELNALGLTGTQLQAIHRLLARPSGLIVVTGYAGSGKTTLQYALLKSQTRWSQHYRILTIEDPVEQMIEGLTQIQVNESGGLSFADAMSQIRRADPDAVLIGRLPDRDVAEKAIELALTRCRVVTELAVSSAAGVPARLRDMGVGAAFLTAQAFAGAIGIRLVRKICPNCVIEYAPNAADLQKLGLSSLEDGPFRRGGGCLSCAHTGFKGRVALFEVLESTDALRRMIADNAPESALWQEAFGRGGSLWDDARAKVRQGVTTVEEVTWALFDYPHPRAAFRVTSLSNLLFTLGDNEK